MYLLLPYRFKRIGVVMAPLGFTCWLLMQWGYSKKLLAFIRNEDLKTAIEGAGTGDSVYYYFNVTIAIISFFSFLAGLYFIAFSKEKIEDEMIARARQSSFLFAGLAQLVFIFLSFAFMAFYGDPGAEGMMLFFIAAIILFWMVYIFRFHFAVYIRFWFLKKETN